MDVIKFQRFLVQFRLLADTLVLPGGNIAEVNIITLCFAVRHLVFNAEMATAGLFTGKASLQSSSPNSRKSATRPAFSSC